MLLKNSFKDVIVVDERVIRIYDKVAAQTLRFFMVSVGFIYISLIVLQSVSVAAQVIWNSLLSLVNVVLLLMLLHYAVYLYYKRKM